MAVTVSFSPAYPAAGQSVKLVGTATVGDDAATEWELTSVPRQSALALGMVMERHPRAVRLRDVSLTFEPRDDTRRRPARILRPSGSFAADGFTVGMQVDITGSSSNDRRVEVALVEPLALSLAAGTTLIRETTTGATLTGAAFADAGGAGDVLVPDVPGEYGLTAYEVFTWPGLGGGFIGDPLSAPQRRLLSSATATLYVGGYLDLPIEPVNGHGSTLRILVVDNPVDDTTEGVVRGAALVNPRTELARVAALDSTVSAAIAALVGVAVADVDVDFATDVNALATAYEAHRVMTGGPAVHASADTTNAMAREPANSIPAGIQRLNDLAAKLTAHQQATTSGGTWHSADDGKNTLQVGSQATTLAQAVVLKADLRERVYERHRAQTGTPASHGTADNTNTMASPLTLPAAIAAYLDFIATPTPAIPSGEAEGVGDAQASLGFTAV